MLHLDMLLRNIIDMNQGYFYIGLGRKYINESFNLMSTIKKFDTIRHHGILVENDDFEFAKGYGFDVILVNDYIHPLYDTAVTSFEKYCLIPRITFNEYLPFNENLVLDSDILCIDCPKNAWKFFQESSQDFNMTGLKFDSQWHWGTINNVSNKIGKNVPHTHGGIFYIRNIDKLSSFFRDCHKIYLNYEHYGLLKNFRGGRVDEPIFAVAMALNNLLPLDFIKYPIITFNYNGNIELPNNLQTVNNLNIKCETNIPFVHMFEKSDGDNYKTLLKRILI